ncbi:MAG: glutamine-hydrolyzing carbamoyl-phosphate synthase small subunit [Planctomycetota bacterium]
MAASSESPNHCVDPKAVGPKARLVFSDGTQFRGHAFGAVSSTTIKTPAAGEVVFTTGMVGYPESMTDPSYRGQILVMTYPLVGNYGVRPRTTSTSRRAETLMEGFESERIQVSGLVVSTLSHDYSHWQATNSLSQWLAEEGVLGICDIDTRALTQKLRHGGCQAGKIVIDAPDRAPSDDPDVGPFEDISLRNLVAEVSIREPILYGDGATRIVLVDCGAKQNIIRSLLARGASVLRVPWDYDLARADGDAILVSNGPGDPRRADATIAELRRALNGDRPIFGICLGNQLVGRALGCETYKLAFGHRSQNQPCREVGTQRCYITSQNHGYALDVRTLPEDWQEWFVNANDGTNEGIRHRSRQIYTVQFHPEATPGPRDTAFLFDRFLESVR